MFLTSLLLYVSCSDKKPEAGIRIWDPNFNNIAGHVAIFTPNYYMSFWPRDISSRVICGPVDACLHLTSHYDAYREGNRQNTREVPIKDLEHIKALEQYYEAFLDLNNIKKEDVRRDSPLACEWRDWPLKNRQIFLDYIRLNHKGDLSKKNDEWMEKKWQKWYQDNIKKEVIASRLQEPKQALSAKYSLKGRVVDDFQDHPQCCTTFTLSLLKKSGFLNGLDFKVVKQYLPVNFPIFGFAQYIISVFEQQIKELPDCELKEYLQKQYKDGLPGTGLSDTQLTVSEALDVTVDAFKFAAEAAVTNGNDNNAIKFVREALNSAKYPEDTATVTPEDSNEITDTTQSMVEDVRNIINDAKTKLNPKSS